MQSLWMLFASFMFSLMGVCVKLASAFYSTSEIVMYRGMIGMAMLGIFVTLQGGTLKTALPWHHAWRGLVGVIALWLWFSAISMLSLPTAVTLNYMAPIWMAALLFFGGLVRGQSRFQWSLVAAILLSFAGVAFLLQPSVEAGQGLGGLFGLMSGFLSALAYLQVRKLGHLGEPEYRVVFYFSLTSVLAGFAGCFLDPSPSGHTFSPHSTTGILLLLGIGITATVAQVAMTRAYRLGNVLLSANLQYTGIVFSSLLSLMIWGDRVDALGWLGIVLILISGMTATYYNVRGAAAKPLPATSSTAPESR
jgi:S-adenosylmethionine uptake transporter